MIIDDTIFNSLVYRRRLLLLAAFLELVKILQCEQYGLSRLLTT